MKTKILALVILSICGVVFSLNAQAAEIKIKSKAELPSAATIDKWLQDASEELSIKNEELRNYKKQMTKMDSKDVERIKAEYLKQRAALEKIGLTVDTFGRIERPETWVPTKRAPLTKSTRRQFLFMHSDFMRVTLPERNIIRVKEKIKETKQKIGLLKAIKRALPGTAAAVATVGVLSLSMTPDSAIASSAVIKAPPQDSVESGVVASSDTQTGAQ